VNRLVDIRAAVEDELIFDPALNASRIAVTTMSGDVTLRGTVPSYLQYLKAADAVRRIAGVTSVCNDLAVVLPPGDHREDHALTAAANTVLTLNVTVPAGVDAAAHDGSITLTGTVRYGSQRVAAERAVARLIGVRNIIDAIEIRWDAKAVDAAAAVRSALDRYALVPEGSDVVVETSGSTVTLTGHVRTWAERDAMLNAAWMTPGVYAVCDELRIVR
jgi:osmotically-inducible protein OsmY